MLALAVPLPIAILGFVFIFFYGLASGETEHPLWQASSFAVVLMLFAGFYVWNQVPW